MEWVLAITYFNKRNGKESSLMIPIMDDEDAKEKAKEFKLNFKDKIAFRKIGNLKISIYCIDALDNVKPTKRFRMGRA